MQEQTGLTDDIAIVDIVLEGGPRDIPDAVRLRRAESAQYDIKVQHHGGYEHFARTSERSFMPGEPRVIYRWVYRTRIAE
jgi:hypothetical protein